MIKNWLKRAWNSRPFLGLLLAGALSLGAAGSASRAAEPAPAPPQGAQAAKSLARKAAAAPKGAQSAPAKQASSAAAPAAPASKWGQVEAGRRDPFNLPKPAKAGEAEAGVGIDQASGELPKGKKGLVISQLNLEGIVSQKASNSNIAVVRSPVSRAAFFLRENDEVYNGVVSKITPDSIYFTENGRDLSGQIVSRQVVKKLGSGPGEK